MNELDLLIVVMKTRQQRRKGRADENGTQTMLTSHAAGLEQVVVIIEF
jgi:hypothetical protein